nr:hypothetical protein GCM10020093_080520 [Planobispora longispora]
MSVRLVIVDDHPVVRDGLRGMFVEQADLEVVGEAEDGARGLAVAVRERPDVVLTDLRMPGGERSSSSCWRSGCRRPACWS